MSSGSHNSPGNSSSSPLPNPAMNRSSNVTAIRSHEEWWVLKEDNRFGPFDYLEIVRLLQKRRSLSESSGDSQTAASQSAIQDWDYVWTRRMTEWKRISTLPEFRPQVIKGLRKELAEKLGNQVNEVFFRRRFARANLSSTLLIHDNQRLMPATSVEVSAGGMSLKLTEGALAIGSKVMVHFRPSAEVPAFNAECEVLSRRITNASDPMSPVVYGLKFVNVDDQVTTDLEVWANRKNQMNDLVSKEMKASNHLGVAFPPTPLKPQPASRKAG